ncbi:hypothetical protein M2282_002277 [Variovorax boronicumulans]|uniref:HORMA-1 domain-containing protein n=1 Tax=Variovorax boronicumulans TaxID=436515 RepID=UPI0024770994|nr:hypothetical protein [Variovorax boronicumulans]MDH6167128.1 hypothetical protein [Variovorax boronicumulans]
MSYSYTVSEAKTFTLTHARHLAAKVATDLKRMQRFYGSPSDTYITNLEGELTELLKHGGVSYVLYGFKRNGVWIEPTLRYDAKDLADGSLDDDPGRVLPGKNIDGASFYSYLVHSSSWYRLSDSERQEIEARLPIQRTSAAQPTAGGSLYFADDRTYSSGGRALARSTLRSY